MARRNKNVVVYFDSDRQQVLFSEGLLLMDISDDGRGNSTQFLQRDRWNCPLVLLLITYP